MDLSLSLSMLKEKGKFSINHSSICATCLPGNQMRKLILCTFSKICTTFLLFEINFIIVRFQESVTVCTYFFHDTPNLLKKKIKVNTLIHWNSIIFILKHMKLSAQHSESNSNSQNTFYAKWKQPAVQGTYSTGKCISADT